MIKDGNGTITDLGKADWMYDADWFGDGSNIEMHTPCCSNMVPKPNGKIWHCGNGPLTGDEITTGMCGECDPNVDLEEIRATLQEGDFSEITF